MVDTSPGLLRPGTRSSMLAPKSVTSDPRGLVTRGEVIPRGCPGPMSSSVSMLISPELCWASPRDTGEWPESARLWPNKEPVDNEPVLYQENRVKESEFAI